MPITPGNVGTPSSITSGMTVNGPLSFSPSAKPLCIVHQLDQSIASGSDTKVSFDQVYIDTTTSFDTTNKRYVVPVAGIYRLHAYVVPDGSQNPLISIRKNNTIIANVVNNETYTGVRFQIQITYIDTAATIGDYYEVFYSHTSGANRTLRGNAAGPYPSFQIIKLN